MSRLNYSLRSVRGRHRIWLIARSLSAVLGLLLGTLEPSASEAQETPAGDREIRVTRVTNGLVTTLTLVLRGPQGVLPISLVLRATQQAQSRSNTPTDFAMDFHMPTFAGRLDFQRPHYVLSIDEGSADHDIVEGSVDERQPIFAVSQVSVPFDLVSLSRLSRARAVRGRIFGVEFTLTPQQVRSIGEFALRALQRSQ